MKGRIAIWTVVGGLVVGLWSMYLFTVQGEQRGFVSVLLDLTCPIAIARPHPLSIFVVILANALTYALVGLAIESIRRPIRRPLNV